MINFFLQRFQFFIKNFIKGMINIYLKAYIIIYFLQVTM